jgi:predicted negative regulator of RcsB-dependent stress response
LFLLGSIAAAQGQSDRACRLLEQGAAHHYRGQGADGLFLLGELYTRSGKHSHATRAYEAAAARDPQGVAARWARQRRAEIE